MLPLSIYIQSYSLCNIFPTGTISESQSVATKVKPTTRDPEKVGSAMTTAKNCPSLLEEKVPTSYAP